MDITREYMEQFEKHMIYVTLPSTNKFPKTSRRPGLHVHGKVFLRVLCRIMRHKHKKRAAPSKVSGSFMKGGQAPHVSSRELYHGFSPVSVALF